MSKTVPAIRSVKARGVVVPLKRPLKNAFGVFDAGPLVLIDVETDQGVTGHAYIFAYANMTIKPLVHLIEEIGRELTGKPVPRICFLPTASGDPREQATRFHERYAGWPCEPSILSLFHLGRDRIDPLEHLLAQDVIYVGGGSMRNCTVASMFTTASRRPVSRSLNRLKASRLYSLSGSFWP